MKSYAEKLKDPRWQKKRLKVLERDEFRCQLCWNDKEMLVAHHKYYKRGKDPWEYPMKALITLCDTCHKKISKKNASAGLDAKKVLEMFDVLSKYAKMIRHSNDEITFKAISENIGYCIDHAKSNEYDYSEWDYNSFVTYVAEDHKVAVDVETESAKKAHTNFFAKYKDF